MIALLSLPGNFFAFLTRLGQTDGNRLLAAFDLATLTSSAALSGAAFIAMHLPLNFASRTPRIFSSA
jgi:hypothetical protein